jgi:hypothetical protein
MISWADVESRAMRPEKERQLREYAKMELGSSRLTNLLAEIFGAIGGAAGPRGRNEPKIETGRSEIQVDGLKAKVTR